MKILASSEPAEINILSVRLALVLPGNTDGTFGIRTVGRMGDRRIGFWHHGGGVGWGGETDMPADCPI